MVEHLADPKWSDAGEVCPACGYALAGLKPPMPCPECGLPFTGRQFIVYGVPSARSIMPRWRIAVIAALCVSGIVLPQLLVGLIIARWWAVLIGVSGAIALAVLALVITAPRSQGGRSRFVFVKGGVNVTPLKIDETKGVDPRKGFIRFNGDEVALLKAISSVWARLTIMKPDRSIAFQAGIRCPKREVNRLLATIDELIRGREASTTDAPPTA